ncbi:MAG TPA: hypothetical protein VFT22_22085 [Kofleriaceae bacterium]|nr:hypothetical protein [Kofleriaceae bacterium]
MLPSFSRGLRLALILALSAGYLAWHGHGHSAYAAKGGDDDEEGDDGDEADKADKGDDSDEGDDGADDKDQPPFTAGGLFTMRTYPVNELLRPLTMTQKIAQVRVGVGTDISAKGAFSSGGLSVEALYGMADNFTILGGVTDAYNFKQFGIYAGFEGSLAYDLVDIRVAANIHRNAIARYCDTDPEAPANCMNSDGSIPSIPDGNYDAGGTKFSVDLGFPFRYAIRPEIAIIALQTLMSIDFNQARDRPRFDAMGKPVPGDKGQENGVKPDLNPSIGIATNPIPALSLVVFGQLRIPDFDTSEGSFQVPVTGRVEFSPNQKLDIGLEFTLLNVKPPGDQSPIDNRFISLFVQSRIGK